MFVPCFVTFIITCLSTFCITMFFIHHSILKAIVENKGKWTFMNEYEIKTKY
jgi:hypothetical protein